MMLPLSHRELYRAAAAYLFARLLLPVQGLVSPRKAPQPGAKELRRALERPGAKSKHWMGTTWARYLWLSGQQFWRPGVLASALAGLGREPDAAQDAA